MKPNNIKFAYVDGSIFIKYLKDGTRKVKQCNSYNEALNKLSQFKNRKRIKRIKLSTLLWCKKKRLSKYNVPLHPECEKTVTKICERIDSINLELNK